MEPWLLTLIGAVGSTCVAVGIAWGLTRGSVSAGEKAIDALQKENIVCGQERAVLKNEVDNLKKAHDGLTTNFMGIEARLVKHFDDGITGLRRELRAAGALKRHIESEEP